MQVEIAYAEPHCAIVKVLRLAPGSRVADALRMIAVDPDFAAVDLANAAVGIFGKLTHADHALQEGDRIEIYRPLSADPKAARRARVRESRRASAINKSGRS
jgi:putative ubiquitin-RnfH superfamily antitoxin RatB of RatAB toxin-antitoxin module